MHTWFHVQLDQKILEGLDCSILTKLAVNATSGGPKTATSGSKYDTFDSPDCTYVAKIGYIIFCTVLSLGHP